MAGPESLKIVGVTRDFQRGGEMELARVYIDGYHPEVARIPVDGSFREIGVPIRHRSPLTGREETKWEIYGTTPDVDLLVHTFIRANRR